MGNLSSLSLSGWISTYIHFLHMSSLPFSLCMDHSISFFILLDRYLHTFPTFSPLSLNLWMGHSLSLSCSIPRCTYILFIHLSSLSLSLCMCHSIFLTLYIFSQHYLSVLSKWPPSPMWPALAKFHHFGNFLIGSLSILEQFWTYFGQLFMLLGKLS